MAVSHSGELNRFDGTSWTDLGGSGQYSYDLDGPTPLACAATYLCMVGNSVLIHGAIDTTWTVPTSTNVGSPDPLPLVSASCSGRALCVAADSQAVTVWRPGISAPSVIKQPAGAMVRRGKSHVLTATFSGSPAPSITWQKSTDGSRWSAAGSGKSIKIAPKASTYYRAIARNAYGTATTAVVRVRVQKHR